MVNKVSIFVFSIFVFNISFSDSEQSNDTNISNQSIIEIGAYNIQKNDEGNYLIDIYASNNRPIAGIQFELIGEDFEILDASGGRAGHSGFSFYNGKGGIILAFSLEGKTVASVEDVYKKMNPLLSIVIKKNHNRLSEFNLKTLIAGKKGTKLESTFIPVLISN